MSLTVKELIDKLVVLVGERTELVNATIVLEGCDCFGECIGADPDKDLTTDKHVVILKRGKEVL